MKLTPEDAAELRSMLTDMAARITELETDVARLRAEHEELKAEQAKTRAKLDSLLRRDMPRKEPGEGTSEDGDPGTR